jgi:hypothetical protein
MKGLHEYRVSKGYEAFNPRWENVNKQLVKYAIHED